MDSFKIETEYTLGDAFAVYRSTPLCLLVIASALFVAGCEKSRPSQNNVETLRRLAVEFEISAKESFPDEPIKLLLANASENLTPRFLLTGVQSKSILTYCEWIASRMPDKGIEKIEIVAIDVDQQGGTIGRLFEISIRTKGLGSSVHEIKEVGNVDVFVGGTTSRKMDDQFPSLKRSHISNMLVEKTLAHLKSDSILVNGNPSLSLLGDQSGGACLLLLDAPLLDIPHIKKALVSAMFELKITVLDIHIRLANVPETSSDSVLRLSVTKPPLGYSEEVINEIWGVPK